MPLLEDRIPVIFDTDIGSDIDDAVALAYLLCEPRCELVGITTVSGEPIERAKLASALCIAAGKPEIPIHPGAVGAFIGECRQPHAPQAEALSKWPHATDFEPNSAVEWMRKTIRERPGEIVLMAVGPMTNIGLLFTLDPEIPKLLKGIVYMCGLFTSNVPWNASLGTAEWNALNDPVATHVAYEAGKSCPMHVSYGLDVTLWCRLKADEVRERFTGKILEVVRSYAEVWFKHSEELTFHDPLAIVSTFHPEICEYATGYVDIELESKRSAGLTHWRADGNGPHTIAVKVDPAKFFERYFGVTRGK